MKLPINDTVKLLLTDKLKTLEDTFNTNILTYYGLIVDGNENIILRIIEELVEDIINKKEKLFVI